MGPMAAENSKRPPAGKGRRRHACPDARAVRWPLSDSRLRWEDRHVGLEADLATRLRAFLRLLAVHPQFRHAPRRQDHLQTRQQRPEFAFVPIWSRSGVVI